MTARERMVEIGEQFVAERKVFDNLRVAATRVGGVASFTANGALARENSGPDEPRGLAPGEFGFGFAGWHFRVRHVFKALGNGMFASVIEWDAPDAPENERAHLSACLTFDRHGAVEWADVGLCGPILKENPEELLFAVLTRHGAADPKGQVPESLQRFRNHRGAKTG